MRVSDSGELPIPDAPGSSRLDSLDNILANGLVVEPETQEAMERRYAADL